MRVDPISNAMEILIKKNSLEEAAIEAAMRKIHARERANGETELSYEEWEISGENEGCENK